MQETIEIFKGLLTPVIGVIAVYIAFQQHKTNRLRELRESRKAKLDVYTKVKLFLNDVDCNGTVPEGSYKEFGDALAEADFLFPEDITDWLEELYSWATEWRDKQEAITDDMKETDLTSAEFWAEFTKSPVGANTVLNMEQCIDILQNAHCDVKQKFSKYLELK